MVWAISEKNILQTDFFKGKKSCREILGEKYLALKKVTLMAYSNRVCTDLWIQNSRLFPYFLPKQQFLFPDPRLSNR